MGIGALITVGPRPASPLTWHRFGGSFVLRVHLGCGPHILPGWVDLDLKPYAGVDQICDVRDGLPFEDAAFIFAEHFSNTSHWTKR
jgi:hypothetical protein